MIREIDNRSILDKFCEEFCHIIDNYCKYIVVSGFVAIASGRTRGTEDIDMIIERLDLDKFTEIFNVLTENGFTCMQSSRAEDVYEYLEDNTSVRFTWQDQPIPEMEVKFAKDVIDEYQLQNRVKLELTGLDVWFSDINTNVAFKEEFLKSPKDMEDARYLRVAYKEVINEEIINNVKRMITELR